MGDNSSRVEDVVLGFDGAEAYVVDRRGLDHDLEGTGQVDTGWVGGWVGDRKVEEIQAVGMRCCG